ncbi:MAG: flavin-containing monooxygenase [Solirubrobacteraceae bacterium]
MAEALHAQETTDERPLPDHVRIAIVGAGFAGMGMGIRLLQEGERDFVILERDSDVGGTWSANTYPGCQCDIPSHLYSFSFAPNPDWTRTYPKQPELRTYLRGVAERFGVRPHIHLGCEVTGAEWDDDDGLWRIESSRGALTADVLIGAPGPLSEPSIPEIDGLERFEGTVFHTARWNHDHDLTGRRVAVIGTGASAIQAVPEIQQVAEHLTVVQRTPPWVVPHNDRPISALESRVYERLPVLQKLARSGVYWGRELLVPALAYKPGLMKVVERLARRHLARQVPDPVLREKVTPSYTIGCKRILPSNKWYPALGKPNVDLVTAGVREIRPEGFVDGDGVLHEVDTIVLATGFKVTDIPMAHAVRGAGGRSMAEGWAGSPQAYLGTAIARFPNMFFLVGPNTGLGHNSMVFMIEAQITYVLDALRTMRARNIGRLEVRPEAQAAYNEAIQKKLEGSVWNTGGCSSWYLDANGRNTTIWPDFTWRFWKRTREFDPAPYVLTPARTGEPVRIAA